VAVARDMFSCRLRSSIRSTPELRLLTLYAAANYVAPSPVITPLSLATEVSALALDTFASVKHTRVHEWF